MSSLCTNAHLVFMLLETSDQSTTARSNAGTYPRSVGLADIRKVGLAVSRGPVRILFDSANFGRSSRQHGLHPCAIDVLSG
jgi:hypothetical protein